MCVCYLGCSHKSETEKSFLFNRVVSCFFGGLIFGTCLVLEPREGKSRNCIQPEKYMAWKEQLVLAFLTWILEGTKGQG